MSSQIPVLSVHSPCLLVTARVWSTDPLVKLARSIDMAERLGAGTVVVHPPFLWQRAAAANFAEAVAELQDRTEVRIAVENMFPVKVRGDRGEQLSAALESGSGRATAGSPWICRTPRPPGTDALELADMMGDRLGHLHLADGSGSSKDEHLVPGRGAQPCAEILERLARNGFDGSVVVEISTRGRDADAREADLAEALTFARLNLATTERPAPDIRRRAKLRPCCPGHVTDEKMSGNAVQGAATRLRTR